MGQGIRSQKGTGLGVSRLVKGDPGVQKWAQERGMTAKKGHVC